MAVFPPFVVGLFGLGTGYFIWGGSTLSGWPKHKTPEFERTMGMWAIWMPGFMQFFAGVYLFLGLTVFNSFSSFAGYGIFYVAAFAFTAYGVHWFVMGWRRYKGDDGSPDAFMAIAFLWISIIGAVAFFLAKDPYVGGVFILLALIYVTEAPARFMNSPSLFKLVAVWQVANGILLMYLSFAFTLNFALGYALPA